MVSFPSMVPTSLARGPWRTTEYLTIAATSVAMYRLQQTGDAWVIAQGAGAIVALTLAKALADGIELLFSRLLGLKAPTTAAEDATPAADSGDVDQ